MLNLVRKIAFEVGFLPARIHTRGCPPCWYSIVEMHHEAEDMVMVSSTHKNIVIHMGDKAVDCQFRYTTSALALHGYTETVLVGIANATAMIQSHHANKH